MPLLVIMPFPDDLCQYRTVVDRPDDAVLTPGQKGISRNRFNRDWIRCDGDADDGEEEGRAEERRLRPALRLPARHLHHTDNFRKPSPDLPGCHQVCHTFTEIVSVFAVWPNCAMKSLALVSSRPSHDGSPSLWIPEQGGSPWCWNMSMPNNLDRQSSRSTPLTSGRRTITSYVSKRHFVTFVPINIYYLFSLGHESSLLRIFLGSNEITAC